MKGGTVVIPRADKAVVGEICDASSWQRIAPNKNRSRPAVNSCVSAAGRVFPLCFGWKPSTGPSAIVLCFAPSDVHHRIRIFPSVRGWFWKRAAGQAAEKFVLGDGDQVPVHAESIQSHTVSRLFSLL